jgi:hypothetical protein
VDPLDAIWLSAIAKVGFRVERSSEVYAATEGARLVLGAPETLDPDDCLAQMIFHELCHSLVQGPERLRAPDWGLSNLDDRDVVREHATLRLQARLAAEHGLRVFLAPTTDFRAYYDALPEAPFDGDDPAVPLAREGWARVDMAPWGPHLRGALRATERVLRAVVEVGAGDVVPGGDPSEIQRSLLGTFKARRGRAGT